MADNSTAQTETGQQEPSLGARVASVMDDTRILVEQHAQLIYAEVQADLMRFVSSIVMLVAGIVVVVPGLLLLAFMCVHLIHWAIQDKPSEAPLWLGFAVVGGLLMILGSVFLGAGVVGLRSFNPVPDRSLAILWKNLGSVANLSKA